MVEYTSVNDYLRVNQGGATAVSNDLYRVESKLDYTIMMAGSRISPSSDVTTMYDRVSDYYHKGLWDQSALSDAVNKNWITQDEYDELTTSE